MYVIKRDGKRELVKYDKITNRIRKQTYSLNTDYVEALEVAKKVIQGVYDGVSSVELDNLAAETAASMTSVHPDYSILASRIAITSLHKSTKKSFVETMRDLHTYVDTKTGKAAGMIDDDVMKFIESHSDEIENAISYDRDFDFDYFGFKTLEKSYLLKMNGKVAERPQHMWMRVACGIWVGNISEVLKTYDLLSQRFFTHATPTLFNAGTKRPQLSSCFLLMMKDDSLEGIYKTLADCAMISKNSGGIGIHIHNIRGKGAYIKGTNGTSNGIIPMLKVYNETARYVDQGGGKRKGSIAVYLEPWHSDIFDFLDLRKNHGKEELRARDLFLALWIPDLFMKRVEESGKWTLFSPDEAPGLHETYGDEFEKLYTQYESEGRGRKTIDARTLWEHIVESQIETGTPYMLYKDHANRKNNQKNLGTLHGSNLCLSGGTEVRVRVNGEETLCNMIELHSWIERSLPVEILSMNIETGENEWKDVCASTIMNPSAEVIEIEDENGNTLRCTPEHKIWTINRGYVMAKNLKETDQLQLSEMEYTMDISNMLKIRKVQEKEPVFDISVKDNHNFYANGILVSNCTEIMEYTSADEIAVCNLASVSLPMFIDFPSRKTKDRHKRSFNHQKLYDVVYQITKNLNRVIDVNYYPVPEARNSNMKHRPIGIGVQGLADTFAILGLPFASDEAKTLNREIHETIYFAAMTASADLAQKDGSYESFPGSPISQGIFQFDMWGVKPSERWDWESLREKVKKGVRNSLLIAPMPTASTAQILGNNESFEAFTSNLLKRRTIAGEFIVINKHLVEDLIDRNLWSEEMKLKLIANKGSVLGIPEIPSDLQEVYKTVWEIKQRDVIDMSADRGAFICQSQSLNLFIDNCNAAKLTTAHFYAWKKGLKTGMYYLRTKAASEAIAGLGVDFSKIQVKSEHETASAVSCSLDNPEACEACGS